jgi:hypothetical protein
MQIRNAEHFFVVGAQRSGSTWLYNALDTSRHICMLKPLFPEVKYFLKPSNEIRKQEYLKLFKNYDGESVVGEKATTYIESKDTASKIKNTFPNAKIIICLRDPALRAVSNYYFTKNYGIETRSLEEVFIKEIDPPNIDISNFSSNPFEYLQKGFYSNYINNYMEIFPPENIKISFMENFTTCKIELLNIFNHLNINNLPNKLNFKRVNSSNPTNIPCAVIDRLRETYTEDILKIKQLYNVGYELGE